MKEEKEEMSMRIEGEIDYPTALFSMREAFFTNNEQRELYIDFEKHHPNDKECIDYVYNELSGVVYCLLCKEVIKDIHNTGISPKLNKTDIYHPERIYFFSEDELMQIDEIKKDFNINDDYVLVKVQLVMDNLKKRFFRDAEMKRGFYTLETIYPKSVRPFNKEFTINRKTAIYELIDGKVNFRITYDGIKLYRIVPLAEFNEKRKKGIY